MAMMSPLQRRKLEDLIRQNPGALAQLVGAQGGTLGALTGAPEGGVNLAEIAGMAPKEKVVSPASPAPVAQGAPVAAPPVQQAAPMVVNEPEIKRPQTPLTPEALQGLASARAAQIEDRIRAAGVVPEELAKMLAKREERYGKELSDIEEDQKKAGWEALAMAGFKMAQSQSPYFMSALATGMEAGLTGFNAKKAAAAERKARLQEQRENLALDRYQLARGEEDRAAARVTRQMGMTKDQLGITDAATRTALGLETYGPAVEVAKMEPEAKRAAIANVISETDLRYRTDPNARGGGGGGGMLPSGYATLRNSIVGQMRVAQSVVADITRPKAERDAARAQLSELQGQLSSLDSQVGVIPSGSPLGGGGSGLITNITPVTPGAPAATPARQKPAQAEAPAPAPAPKPKPKPAELTPEQRQAAVNSAIRQAQAEARQYEKLPKWSTPLIRMTGERADIRKANTRAVEEAKRSNLPQYRKRPNENYTQYDIRIRRMLNLPEVD